MGGRGAAVVLLPSIHNAKHIFSARACFIIYIFLSHRLRFDHRFIAWYSCVQHLIYWVYSIISVEINQHTESSSNICVYYFTIFKLYSRTSGITDHDFTVTSTRIHLILYPSLSLFFSYSIRRRWASLCFCSIIPSSWLSLLLLFLLCTRPKYQPIAAVVRSQFEIRELHRNEEARETWAFLQTCWWNWWILNWLFYYTRSLNRTQSSSFSGAITPGKKVGYPLTERDCELEWKDRSRERSARCVWDKIQMKTMSIDWLAESRTSGIWIKHVPVSELSLFATLIRATKK